jgi:hypothetical protein
MINALQRLLAYGDAEPTPTDDVESAVNGLVREAEDLCRLLRHRREMRKAKADGSID